jgi:G3E family GTPase
MKQMKLHLVGGFLGSGKTTAIIQAARSLMAQGKKVGVVTNDQGKYLVDTAFFRLGDVPAVEVTGGCFCCNYDDLDARLDQIRSEIQPDVVFAESVGSCGDLVATVIKPLIELRALRASEFQPASFSVFTDCRMLNAHLNGDGLPFSDNVVYIFEKQIEEAGILVINKIDLMAPAAVEALVASANARFPGMTLVAQSSLDAQGIRAWLETIDTARVALPETPLAMDYQRYGDGEAQLAWLDEEITLQVPDGQGQTAVTRLLDAIRTEIRAHGAAVGHLKFLVQGGGAQAKISITTLSGGEVGYAIPTIPGSQVSLLVNARVEMPAEELHDLLDRALAQVSAGMNSGFSTTGVSYFHPRYPTPTHRMV